MMRSRVTLATIDHTLPQVGIIEQQRIYLSWTQPGQDASQPTIGGMTHGFA